LGIILWALPMYVSGFTQSLMWKQFNPDGTLVYGNFLETVTQLLPFYLMRAIGGILYLIGALIFVFNIIQTAISGKFLAQEEAHAAPLVGEYKAHKNDHWHRIIERKPVQMIVWVTIMILIGGLIEIIPTITVNSNIPQIAEVKPYTALELEGRDLYIREGCNACHSQMIRPFRSEVARYGEYSKAGEFVYDHPFLWGSKRTGPDLAREGGKKLRKSHAWHYNHMWEPTSMSPGSIMPRYPWLFTVDTEDYQNDGTLNTKHTAGKLKAMQKLGVPYSNEYIENWQMELEAQAASIADELNRERDISVNANEEIIALIAYLQRLGTDIEKRTSSNDNK